MKYIELTQGKRAMVDDEDFEYLNQWKWCYHSGGYACRRKHYPSSRKNQKYEIILMHRFIMGLEKGNKQEIDHKDHNRINNVRSNLRICNNLLNGFNKSKRKGTSSIYKGVVWYKAYRKWAVNIQKKYRKFHVGYFNTETEAALAYNRKAIELFGEYAKLNEVN